MYKVWQQKVGLEFVKVHTGRVYRIFFFGRSSNFGVADE